MSASADRPLHGGRLVVLILVAVAFVVALGVYKVWYHYQTLAIGQSLAAETLRHRELFGRNRALRLELESMKREGLAKLAAESPTRLKVPAAEDLIRVRQ